VWTRPRSLEDDYALVRFDVNASGGWVAYAEGQDLFVLPLYGIETATPRLIGRGETKISRVFFHPDGRRIATFESVDEQLGKGVMRLWTLDGNSPRPPRSFDAPMSVFRDKPAVRARTIRFDPDGKWMAAPTVFDRCTLLWDLSAPPGTLPMILRNGETVARNAVAVHPKGQWLAGAGVDVSLWPLARDYPHVLQRQADPFLAVVFDPLGKYLYASAWDGKIRAWSLDADGLEAGTVLFESGSIPIHALGISPDGRRLAAALWDGRIVIVPVSGEPTRTLSGFHSQCAALAFDRSGRRVAAAGGGKLADDALIRIWDLESGEVRILDPGVSGSIWSVEFTSDGDLVSGDYGGLRLWNLDTGDHEMLLDRGVSGTLSADGRYVAGLRLVSDAESVRPTYAAFVYDLERRESWEWPNGADRPWLDWHPSGRFIVYAANDGTIRVGSPDGEEPHLLMGHQGAVTSVKVHPDGRWIASTSYDGTLRLWPMPQGRPLQTLAYDDFIERLRSLTNYRVVPDREATTGYRLDLGPFPGWEELPTW
jgi:WD40 repeat protein